MSIKVGDSLPAGSLSEFIEVEGNGCSLGPNTFQVSDMVKGKKIVLFAVPGAFTPTCSAKHVPSYRDVIDQFKAKGVDEVWCLSVNDPFVMGAWARDQQVAGKIRMLADGSGIFTKELGLELDLISKGLGIRSDRYSMLIENGVVKALHREAPGKFEVSDGATMLKTLSA